MKSKRIRKNQNQNSNLSKMNQKSESMIIDLQKEEIKKDDQKEEIKEDQKSDQINDQINDQKSESESLYQSELKSFISDIIQNDNKDFEELKKEDQKEKSDLEKISDIMKNDLLSESEKMNQILLLSKNSDHKSESLNQNSSKLNLRSEMKKLIEEKKYNQKEILSLLSERFPSILRSTISTILSDSKNERYNKFEYLIKIENDIYQFSDIKNLNYKK